MSILTQEYTKIRQRMIKAESFLDGNAPADKKDKWIPEFKKLLCEAEKLIHKIEQELDREMTEEEILNGFKEDT
jgi:hypothetical protein